MVGLDGLKGFFQPKYFCDSMTLKFSERMIGSKCHSSLNIFILVLSSLLVLLLAV